jgi:hypothetical protein
MEPTKATNRKLVGNKTNVITYTGYTGYTPLYQPLVIFLHILLVTDSKRKGNWGLGIFVINQSGSSLSILGQVVAPAPFSISSE